jgi:hypothetical protein
MNFITKAVLTTTFAVAAFAADTKLNFQVDFPFQVGKISMPAGTYVVSGSNDASPGIRIENVQGKNAAFVTLPARLDSQSAGRPSVDFRCVESQCSIVAIDNLRSGTRFATWALKANRPQGTIISVNLTPVKSNAD